MRHKWNHKTPANIQPEPADNTSAFVHHQTAVWRDHGQRIHPEIAMEIAAWWQSPGTDGMPFTEFAGTGTVTENLLDAIDRELSRTSANEDVRALSALQSYVRAI